MAFIEGMRRRRGPILLTTKHDWKIASKDTNQLERSCASTAFILLWVLMIFVDFWYVMPLAKRGIIFSTSTKEECKIVDYVESDCKYKCDCTHSVDANGDHQSYCKRCSGKQYIYSAIVESKCGERVLVQTKYSQKCPDNEYKINDKITCYVPHCHYKTFTYHHHYKIIFEAVVLSIIVVGIIVWIPYHLCTQHTKKKLVLTL